jgi:hypothetical protein
MHAQCVHIFRKRLEDPEHSPLADLMALHKQDVKAKARLWSVEGVLQHTQNLR